MIRNFFHKLPILSSLLLVFIAVGLLILYQKILINDNTSYSSGVIILAYAAPIVFVVAMAFILKLQGSIALKKHGFLKGIFLFGLPLIGFSIVSFLATLTITEGHENVSPTLMMLIFFTSHMLLIGVLEEFLFRGIILNNMLRRWGENKKGIIMAVIWSSLLFGCAHLANLINNPDILIGTISQLIYTFCIGVFLAAIYIRFKNIWPAVILHAFFNWMALIWTLSYPTIIATEGVDIEIGILLGRILLMAPFAIIGFVYLIKVWQPKNTGTSYYSVRICHNCQTRVKEHDDFCFNCGIRLQDMLSCPSCAKKSEIEAVFCRYCGSELNKDPYISTELLSEHSVSQE
ncbi:MAG: CPBP family glutamic-type intramembrane protease [Chloroflexi bacterium]|nr:CPBP family glutamic-type intramembrane protease [Chloroflexota bacterium]